MRKIRMLHNILRVLAAIIVIVALTACSSKTPETVNVDLFAMDTFMSVKAYTSDSEIKMLIENEISRLDGLFSVTNPSSDVARINSNGSAEVDWDTLELVSSAIRLGERTDGALDISVYPLVKLWGFTTGEYRVPDQCEIDNKLQYIDFKNIEITQKCIKIHDGMEIDLGAVSKGYTSDKICELLREHGVGSAVVNLGGNVQTIGRRVDGELWRVGVKNPFDTENNLLIVEVENSAVVTSGNYERFFIGENGVKYCHIIDPETGKPVQNGLASVTIIGESGLNCDGLSTALFVMGREKAIEFWKESDDFEMILVTEDGEICVTEGIYGTCSNLSGFEMVVIGRE